MTSLVDVSAGLLAAAPADPAGGASIEDIGLASGIAGFAIIFLLMGGLGHRSGLQTILAWFERFAEKVSGQPAWASLPCGLAIISLVSAVFGMYWDVSLHVDVGRDVGPLNNPAHYFILAGLYGIFAAGFFAICLPREERADRPGPTSIRITSDWRAPLGGVLMCACGGFALIGFPLDDGWHRLFGQDVTLWGPTHLMLIGGASMTLLGIAVIQAEVRRAMKASGLPDTELLWVKGLRNIALPGGLLVGMSTFQLEFDLGVPQFQLVFHPMLIMLAAGVTLVMTRVWLGAGTAAGAVAFFLAMRGALSLSVGGLDASVAHFPLYVVEAAIVEGVALVMSARRSPLAFGAVCGALIGSVGLAAEWGWSHIWTALPWPAELLPEGVILGFATAVSASLVGAWIGARLGSEHVPYNPALRYAAATSALAIFAMLAFPLFIDADEGVRGTVALRDVDRGAERTIMATVRLSPSDAADEAKWLTATSWQGGGLIVDRLERVREGVYRTTRPVPVHGEWKTMIRLHTANSIVALPIFAPRDSAIPAPQIPAPDRFERPFLADKELLQREARTDQPGQTWAAAYAAVLACALALLGLIAWGIHRVGATANARHEPPTPQAPAPTQPEPDPDLGLPADVWPARIAVASSSPENGGR